MPTVTTATVTTPGKLAADSKLATPAKKKSIAAKKRGKKTGSKARGKPKKSGLRMMQVRALDVLHKMIQATIATIAEKAGVNGGIIRAGIGGEDPDNLDTHGFRSLLSLGLVKHAAREQNKDGDEVGSTMFSITARGEDALAKWKKEHGSKLPPPAAAPYSRNKKKKKK